MPASAVGVFPACYSWFLRYLAPVPQLGEAVPDGLITVWPAVTQANHPAAWDKVPYLVLGHRDQARHAGACWARQEDIGSVATRLKQERCGGQAVRASEPARAGLGARARTTLTIEGDDVGRDVGQLQKDAGQGGVEHVQTVLGDSGLLE